MSRRSLTRIAVGATRCGIRLCAAFALLTGCGGAAAADGDRPPRVASLTVCADQYVLALADRAQIAAVSPHARSAYLSLLADRADGLQAVRPGAEAYLALGVEIVVANGWSDTATTALLERFGVRVLPIPLMDDVDAIAAMTREIGAALGRAERGERLAARLLDAVEDLRRTSPGDDRLGLYLRPDGGTSAEGSFVATLMTAAGLRNQATEQGLRGWARYSLERFVADPPERLVLSAFENPYGGLGGAFGRHPAYVARARTIAAASVPMRHWVCGGWMLADAALRLDAELSR